MPWRAAEDMHWQMGRNELAQRAGVQPFHAAPEATSAVTAAGVPITTSFAPSSAYQPQVYSTSPQSYQAAPPYSSNSHQQPFYTYPPPAQHVQYPPPASYSHPPASQHQSMPPTSAPAPGSYAESSQLPGIRPLSPLRDASTHHARRSESIGTAPATGGLQGAKLSPGSASPRRRALSANRLSAGSIPPIETRTRSPPTHSPLPSMPREYYPGTPPAGHRQQLPPVRLLTEEPAEERRPPPSSLDTQAGASHIRKSSRELNGYAAKTEDGLDDVARRSR